MSSLRYNPHCFLAICINLREKHLHKRNYGIFDAGEILDEPREECGVFGMYDFSGEENVAPSIYYGLLALQHRGQESCGIAVSNTEGPKGKVLSRKGMGLVNENFDEMRMIWTICAAISVSAMSVIRQPAPAL